MDFLRQRTEHSAAVRIGWRVAVGTVLRSRSGNGRKSAIDAIVRRAIHADAILRGPEDGLVAGRARLRGQPEAGARLMRLMGLEAIYPKPRLSLPAPGHKIYPYLLRDLTIAGRTRRGAATSPTFDCAGDSSTWWQ